MSSTDQRVSISEMLNVLNNLYSHTGLPEDEKDRLIDTLMDAELRGIKSHGLLRSKVFYNRMTRKSIKVPTVMEKLTDRKAAASYDGRDGLGPWIAGRAMEEAISKADTYGLGAVSVKNSQHFGTAGYYANLAAQNNMIGLVFTNASPRLAPWGGTAKMFGNNPWAVGMPTHQDGIPFVLDIANSITSAGRIRKAAQQGETIPPDWALNAKGESTTDPLEALQGILLPFGQHKGYGITFSVSLLSALLSGGGFDLDVSPVDVEDRPQRVSHFFVAINIDFFQPLGSFKRRIEELIERVWNNQPAQGVARIYYPGERGYTQKLKLLEEGSLMVDSAVWNDVLQLL